MKEPTHQGSRLKRLKKIIYNPDKKTILGRTAKNWLLLLIFYTCAYIFLASFFVGMLSVFLYGYVQYKSPSRTGEQSVLMNKAGVDFCPRPNRFNTFIQLATYQSQKNQRYLSGVKLLFDNYINNETNSLCGTAPQPTDPDIPCRFPLSELGSCADPTKALIEERNPCIYLKINRIYGWLPDISNSSFLPSPMIECTGVNALDKENLGEPKYYPEYEAPNGQKYGRISNNYFPFLNQPGYQTPLVGVQFPSIRKNTVTLIECQMVGVKNSASGTTFELTVDSSPM